MNRLPDDLLKYLRSNRLADRQKRLIRELALDIRRKPRTAAEYAEMYAKRVRRIQAMLS